MTIKFETSISAMFTADECLPQMEYEIAREIAAFMVREKVLTIERLPDTLLNKAQQTISYGASVNVLTMDTLDEIATKINLIQDHNSHHAHSRLTEDILHLLYHQKHNEEIHE